jgi:hypothetical protein
MSQLFLAIALTCFAVSTAFAQPLTWDQTPLPPAYTGVAESPLASDGQRVRIRFTVSERWFVGESWVLTDGMEPLPNGYEHSTPDESFGYAYHANQVSLSNRIAMHGTTALGLDVTPMDAVRAMITAAERGVEVQRRDSGDTTVFSYRPGGESGPRIEVTQDALSKQVLRRDVFSTSGERRAEIVYSDWRTLEGGFEVPFRVDARGRQTSRSFALSDVRVVDPDAVPERREPPEGGRVVDWREKEMPTAPSDAVDETTDDEPPGAAASPLRSRVAQHAPWLVLAGLGVVAAALAWKWKRAA